MIVGIPGTGIGGFFYLLSALWLPIRGLQRRLRGQAVRSSSGLRQAAMAVGILAAMWFTGELLGLAVARAYPSAASLAAGSTAPLAAHASNFIHAASLIIGVGTLCAVLATVRIARVVVRRTRAGSRPTAR